MNDLQDIDSWSRMLKANWKSRTFEERKGGKKNMSSCIHIFVIAYAGRNWGQEEKGGDRGWDGWMASPMDMSLSKLQKLVTDREAWHAEIH